jgi:hypothetical protein
MCNLYSITTNQAAIIALFRVINRYVGKAAKTFTRSRSAGVAATHHRVTFSRQPLHDSRKAGGAGSVRGRDVGAGSENESRPAEPLAESPVWPFRQSAGALIEQSDRNRALVTNPFKPVRRKLLQMA